MGQGTFTGKGPTAGGLERLTSSDHTGPDVLVPMGNLLAFMENNPTTGYDIWVLR